MGFEFDPASYTLLAVIASLVVIPLFFSKDPDIHPLALQHQSSISHVRNPKESAIYRSLEASLKTGLSVKTEKSYATKDGDIRDVWKLAQEKGRDKIINVNGATVTEVSIADVTRWIHIIGSFIKAVPGVNTVALYLPNTIENLVASFACHYYNLSLVLVPYPAESDTIQKILTTTKSDLLVAAAGTISLQDVEDIQSLKYIIYVVEEGSRQIDWDTPPGTRVRTSTYHELLKGDYNPHAKVPENVDIDGPAIITTYIPENQDLGALEVVEFSHRNIVAAVAAQMASVPPTEQLKQDDVFLPVDSLAELYTRVHTYAALVSGATLALFSVAGIQADLEKACGKVSPTAIVASPHTLLATKVATAAGQVELWHNLIHWFQKRTLASGRIPKGNWLTRLNDYERPHTGNKLRLVFTSHKTLTKTQPLNSLDLADLRIYLGCRVIYALTSPKAAGPICQTNPYDYRVETPEKVANESLAISGSFAHFGGPTGAVEVWLKDMGGYKADDKPYPRGEVWVRGATVPGKEGRQEGVGLGVVGKWRADGALELVDQ